MAKVVTPATPLRVASPSQRSSVVMGAPRRRMNTTSPDKIGEPANQSHDDTRVGVLLQSDQGGRFLAGKPVPLPDERPGKRPRLGSANEP